MYVFTRNGTVWSQQAYIKASNTGSGDHFGMSVALSGDTLAVGATGEASDGSSQSDNSLSDAGAAYVFTRSGTTWTQQAYVKASNPDSDDNFGYSVALFGDTLAVGATGEDSNATGTQASRSTRATTASPTPAPPMCLRAAVRPGRNRRMSRPPIPE